MRSVEGFRLRSLGFGVGVWGLGFVKLIKTTCFGVFGGLGDWVGGVGGLVWGLGFGVYI